GGGDGRSARSLGGDRQARLAGGEAVALAGASGVETSPLPRAAQVMSERWNEVEAILRAALTCAPHERTAFVDEVCGDDSELREEVESLLARETATNEFLSRPAVALMAAEETAAFIGREFGAYTIVDLLGSGGMGDVYRAR